MSDRDATPAAPAFRRASRRSTLRTLAGAGAATALIGLAAPPLARAQATPASAPASTPEAGPIRYVLSGEGAEVVFTPGNDAGEATLEFSDPDVSISASGDDLDVTRLPALGLTASSFVDAVADGYTRYVTLLVPEVNAPAAGTEVPVETVAIMTTHRTTIGGPRLLEGAVQIYQAIALSGTAEFAAE